MVCGILDVQEEELGSRKHSEGLAAGREAIFSCKKDGVAKMIDSVYHKHVMCDCFVGLDCRYGFEVILRHSPTGREKREVHIGIRPEDCQ